MDFRERCFFRREQDEAPHSRVDDLAVGERCLEVARDGAQAFGHLPLAVERAALHVVVDADGKGGEGPALIELLQVRRGRQVAQRPRLAVQEDVGVLEREVLDEDGQHVEGVHDEVRRGVHAHDIADAEHEPSPDQRELLDARPGEAPQADDGQRDHEQQVEVGVRVDDAVERPAVVALRVDGEDESRQRCAEEDERRENGGQVDEPAREERNGAALAHERLDVREVEVGAPDEAEEEDHVGEIERPARELRIMRVHLARQDIEDKCQPLHAEQRAEEAIPPDR